MDRPDWKRVAGCALLVALAASLVRDPPASPPEWLLAGGGLDITAGLAFPVLGERGPVASVASLWTTRKPSLRARSTTGGTRPRKR